MGLFDGVMGGVVGALVTEVVQKHGGVQGIVQQFEAQGFGPTVQSWVGTGTNQPITADQVHQVLGSDLVQQLAAKAGLSVPEITAHLAKFLPQTIDKMTPDGVVPKT